jgi:transposase
MRLTNEQWAAMENLLPKPRAKKRRGRPAADNRACVEGILWVLRVGARWRDLPRQYPSPSTCWRRLRQWEESGVWLQTWRRLLGTLDQRGLLRWEECFLDATFFPAKKGASQSVKRSAARARNAWYWPMARVFLSEFAWRLPRRTK